MLKPGSDHVVQWIKIGITEVRNSALCKKGGVLAGVGNGTLKKLVLMGQGRRTEPGETLYPQETIRHAVGLNFVISGEFEVLNRVRHTHVPSGLIRAGAVVGEVEMFTIGDALSSIKCRKRAELLCIAEGVRIREITDGYLHWNLAEALAVKFRNLHSIANDIKMAQANEQTLRLLKRLATLYGYVVRDGRIYIDYPITKRRISEHIGCHEAQVGRAFSEYKGLGALCKKVNGREAYVKHCDKWIHVADEDSIDLIWELIVADVPLHRMESGPG